MHARTHARAPATLTRTKGQDAREGPPQVRQHTASVEDGERKGNTSKVAVDVHIELPVRPSLGKTGDIVGVGDVGIPEFLLPVGRGVEHQLGPDGVPEGHRAQMRLGGNTFH